MLDVQPTQFIDLIHHPAFLTAGGRIIAANKRLSQISGYSNGELLGMRSKTLLCANPRQDSQEPDPRLATPNNHEVALLKKDGRRVGVRTVTRRLDGRSHSSPLTVLYEAVPQTSYEICTDEEGLLEECLMCVDVGVVVVGRNGLVALVNRKCTELLGYQEDEVIGRPWGNFFATRGDRYLASDYFNRLIAGKVQPRSDFQFALPTKGGQKRVVSWNRLTLLKDISGGIVGVLASFSDVSEYVQLTRTFEHQEKVNRIMSEIAVDGAWVYDFATGKVTYASPSLRNITGFQAEETMKLSLDKRLTPASLKHGISEMNKHLALDKFYNGQPHWWTVELEEYRNDGTTVWVESRASILRDAQGQPIGVLGITRDLSERKLAEKSLRESERRYRTFFENSMDATCIIGRNGRMIDTNRAALALLGYSKEELTNVGIADIASEKERQEFLRQIEKSGYVRNYEMRLRRKDGFDLDCLLTFDLRTDESGNIVGYEGSIRDITDWKRLQMNLRTYAKEAIKVQEGERLRLSRELHDGILQDLLAIRLELENVIRVGELPDGSLKQQIMRIRDKVGLLSREVRGISHALRPTVLDELGLVAAVQTMLQAMDEDHGIKVDLSVVGIEYRLDDELESALFRLIQEALNNVSRHSAGQSVRVRIEFGPSSIKAVVVDDGKGFEVPKRLGDLASAGKLGLIGMEERTKMMGGRFRLESTPGDGTTVAVEIPCTRC